MGLKAHKAGLPGKSAPAELQEDRSCLQCMHNFHKFLSICCAAGAHQAGDVEMGLKAHKAGLASKSAPAELEEDGRASKTLPAVHGGKAQAADAKQPAPEAPSMQAQFACRYSQKSCRAARPGMLTAVLKAKML